VVGMVGMGRPYQLAVVVDTAVVVGAVRH